MTQYNLPFTGTQINEAIEKARVHVVGLDTSPQQGSNKVVNSDGIYTAVTAKINTSDIVTEAQTIAANDVDTKVPSAAAVKDYVDNASASIAYFTASNGSRTSGGVINTFSETSDPGNFCSTDGSTIGINQNTICTVIFSGRYARSSGNSYTWAVSPRVYDNGYYTEHTSFSAPGSSSFSDSDHKRITYTTGFNSIGLNRTMYASIQLNPSFIGQCKWKEVTITVIRHFQA